MSLSCVGGLPTTIDQQLEVSCVQATAAAYPARPSQAGCMQDATTGPEHNTGRCAGEAGAPGFVELSLYSSSFAQYVVCCKKAVMSFRAHGVGV